MSILQRWNASNCYACDECQKVSVVKVAKKADLRKLPLGWVQLRTQWDVGVQVNHYCCHACLAATVAKRVGTPGYK